MLDGLMFRHAGSAFIVATAVAVAPYVAKAQTGLWWTEGDAACPTGATLKGGAPPRATEIGCVKASGVWHGKRTAWFDRCDGEPCPPSRLPKRFEGEYRRGIEHGHWTWWHKNGRKGLEGEFFAGKKTGVWLSWDKQGTERRTEFGSKGGPEASVDMSIFDALEAAQSAGKQDLARELDDASRGLKRTTRQHEATPDGARGHATGESIDARAAIESSAMDLADQEMGAEDFGEDSNRRTTPYVSRAIRRATRTVNKCYRKSSARNARLSGELVARFSIARDGTVSGVAVVRSSMTESMSRCVKQGLRRLKLAPHNSPTAIEVISPWVFRAGR